MPRHLPAVIALAAVSTGCSLYTGDAEPEPEPGTFCERRQLMALEPSRRLDLLILIDDSPSMVDHRDTLLDNAWRFVQVLENIEGGLPNFAIAVANTDIARPVVHLLEHVVRPGWECGNDPAAQCIDTSYAGELAAALAAAVDLGFSGSEIEQPLAVMERALSGQLPSLGDWLHDGAQRMVLFITDEDDSSVRDVDHYASLLGSRSLVAGVIPDDSDGRLPALLDAVSFRGTRTAIESPDWTDAFIALADATAVLPVSPCLFGVDGSDVDPDRVGLQLDCTVESAGQVVPACELAAADRPSPATELPCYWLRQDELVCPGSIVFQVEQPVDPAIAGNLDVRCAGSCSVR